METLTIYEKYSRYWPLAAVLSASGLTISTISFLLIDDVLIDGYVKLAAFCFFSVTLFTVYKLKDGQMEIKVSIREGNRLEMTYSKDKNPVHSEIFDLDTFKELEINLVPNRSIYNDFTKKDLAIRYMSINSNDWSYLHEVHGRVIPLDAEHADNLLVFLKDHISKNSST